MSSSRRLFVLQFLMAAVAIPFSNKGAAQVVKMDTAFPIGIAGYTFYRIDIQTTIRMMQRLGIQYLSQKDIHLPLNSSDEVIKSTMAQFSAGGIRIYVVGVI